MRSGVDAPEAVSGISGGGWRLSIVVGDFGFEIECLFSPRTVVVRATCSVSADGGGGRPANSRRSVEIGCEEDLLPFCLLAAPFVLLAAAARFRNEGRIEALHRKHSPVPK